MEDPFEHVSDGGFSERPFLAQITLTVHSSFYSKTRLYGISESCNDDIRPMFKSSEQFIEKLLEQVEKHAGLIVAHQNMNAKIHAFWAVNTGDVLLAVRSDRIHDAYEIAMKLRSLTYDEPAWKDLSFNSFTMMNAEMVRIDGRYCAPPGNSLVANKNQQEVVILRLRVEGKLLEKLQQLKLDSLECGKPLGMYGHYDITIRVGFLDFLKLYPILCTAKFAPNELKKYKNPFGKDKRHLVLIVEGLLGIGRDEMKGSLIEVINERLSTSLLPSQMDVGGTQDESQTMMWRLALKALKDLAKDLAKHIVDLKDQRLSYRESIRMLQDTLVAYSAIGDQVDSACTGWDLIATMKMLFGSIQNALHVIYELQNAQLNFDDSSG